jgi:hypothetical protein
MLPFFEIPFQIVCSKKLTDSEKMVVASFYTWQLKQKPQEFKKIALIIAMDLNTLHKNMKSLSKKGVIEFDWKSQQCCLLDPDWLYKDAEQFECGPIRVYDEEVA